MIKKIETELFCLHCEKECPHTITYVAGHIKEIHCKECRLSFSIDRKRLLATYMAEKVEEVLTLPRQFTEERRKNLTKFLVSLPIRLMSRPWKMTKEVVDIIRSEPTKKPIKWTR
ncbi:MAG: bh protein [Candidatus Omnitrophica bacterium]|nr:bh protein [Candidatus Omnitrophota bacterium]